MPAIVRHGSRSSAARRGIEPDLSGYLPARVRTASRTGNRAATHRYILEQQAGTWLISTWVNTEFASALSLKCRSGVISRDELMACCQSFQTLREKRLQVLQLEHADFETAARLCLADVPLKAGDALHLAVCQRQRGVLATLDQRLARAALHHQLPLAMIE